MMQEARAIRAWWPLLLLCMLIGAGAGGAVAASAPHVYTSTTQLFVGTAGASDNASAHAGALFTEQRLSSYLQLMGSDRLSDEVRRELRLRTSAQELRSRVTARVVPNTVVIELAASAPTATAARATADAYARSFIRSVSRLETADPRSTATVAVIATGTHRRPSVLISPDGPRDIALGALLGALLAGAAVSVAARSHRRVRNPDDAQEACSRRYARVLLDEARGPGRPPGDDCTMAGQAVRGLVLDVQAAGARTVAVCSCMRPEHRASVSVDLAKGLARNGSRVLLVDTDGQRGAATQALGLPRAPGLTDVLAGRTDLAAAVRVKGPAAPAVLPSGAQAEVRPEPAQLRRMLADLSDDFDVVVLDTPALLSDSAALQVARSSDGAVLVASRGETRRSELTDAAAVLEQEGVPLLEVVLARVPVRTAVRQGWVLPYEPDITRHLAVRGSSDRPDDAGPPGRGPASGQDGDAGRWPSAVSKVGSDAVHPRADSGTRRTFQRMTGVIAAARGGGQLDLLLAQVVPLAAGFLLTMVSATLLGPAGRGILTFLMTASLLVGALAYGSLHVPVVTALRAGDRSDLRHGMQVVATLWGGLSLAGALVVIAHRLVGGSWTLDMAPEVGFALAGAGVVVAQLFAQRVLQGLARNRDYQRVVVSQSMIYLCAAGGALLATRSPMLMFCSWYASALFGVLRAAVVLRRRLGNPTATAVEGNRLDTFLRKALANNLGSIGQMVMLRADVLVVMFVVGPAAAGVYGIALSLTELVLVASEVFSLSVFADRARLTPERWAADLGRTLRMNSGVTVLAAACIAVVAVVLSRTVLAAYTGLVLLVLLILPGSIFAGYSRVALGALQALDSPATVWRFGALALGMAAAYLPAALIDGATGTAVMSTLAYAATAAYLRAGLRARSAELLPA